MTTKHVKVYTGSSILTRRLKSILEENYIGSIIKSDKIPAYEITNYIDELFVLSTDAKKAMKIVEAFKKDIT